MITAFIFSVSAAVIAFTHNPTHFDTIHKIMGPIINGLLGVQIGLGFWISSHESRLRKVHKALGPLIFCAAIIQGYFGILNFENNDRLLIGATIWISLIGIIFAIGEYLKRPGYEAIIGENPEIIIEEAIIENDKQTKPLINGDLPPLPGTTEKTFLEGIVHSTSSLINKANEASNNYATKVAEAFQKNSK